MGPALSPIGTLARDAVASGSQGLKINPLPGKPTTRGFAADLVTPSFAPHEICTFFERGSDGDRQFASKVIVTGAGQAKRSGRREKLWRMQDRWQRDELGQVLNHRRHGGSSQPVITMAALRFDGEQPTFDQLREMTARRRGAHPGGARQLACRQRAAVQQHGQNGGPAGLAKECAHLGNVRLDAHPAMITAEKRLAQFTDG